MKRSVASAALVVALGLVGGCSGGTGSPEVSSPFNPAAKQTVEEAGDLAVASSQELYVVGSKSGKSKSVLKTDQPITSISYTADHLLVTAYQADDPKSFQGMYMRDKQSAEFTAIPVTQLRPKFSYMNGDNVFLVSADKTTQSDGDYTKVGLYSLSAHKWMKDWLVPGAVLDVDGRGKFVYFATSNNKETSSNLYKADVTTGDWGKLIQEARRYPLDEVALDTNGDLYMMITQREKSEWSNKIYRFDPNAAKFELFDHFLTNTKRNSYSLCARQGKGFVVRYDPTGVNDEIEKPLSVVDFASRKQTYITWDHRPVSSDYVNDEFVAVADDGTIGFVKPELAEQSPRELKIEGLESARLIRAKRDGT